MKNIYLVVLITILACRESKQKIAEPGKQANCDTSAINLQFIDDKNGAIVNNAALGFLLKKSEESLYDIFANPKRKHLLDEKGFITLKRKEFYKQYYVSGNDSLLAFIYKKEIGYSKGFYIPLGRNCDTVKISLSDFQ